MELSLATTMPIMVTQIVAMFLMMGVGALAFRMGLIDEAGSRTVTNLACYVSGPAVIVRALAVPFSAEQLANIALVALASLVLLAMCIAVAHIAYGATGNDVAQVGIVVSNMGFVGIPLVQNVLGEEYVIYMSAAMAVQIVAIWTYGVYRISHDARLISPVKVLTNPAVLAVAVGLVMFLCSFELTGVLGSFVGGLGDLNTGLGMLVLGIFLAQSDIRGLARTRSLYKASFLRLVVTALLAVGILALFPLPAPIKAVLLIAYAAPCGSTSAMFCQLFGGDYRYAAGMVTISTLLSLVTMPLILLAGLLVF